ncbi:MAG: TetR/AcrR family transcriptional regulator [Anaerolineae bacterium]
MNAAATCLLRSGFRRLTVTAIAAEADVGRGTFYVYFDNVDAVLLAIGRRYFVGLQAEVHAMMADYESPEKERRAWELAFEKAEALKPLLALMNVPEAAQITFRFQELMIAGFRDSLATNSFLYPQWMNLPTEVMAAFSAGAVLTVMRQWLAGNFPYTAQEMGAMVFRMLYHGHDSPARGG